MMFLVCVCVKLVQHNLFLSRHFFFCFSFKWHETGELSHRPPKVTVLKLTVWRLMVISSWRPFQSVGILLFYIYSMFDSKEAQGIVQQVNDGWGVRGGEKEKEKPRAWRNNTTNEKAKEEGKEKPCGVISLLLLLLFLPFYLSLSFFTLVAKAKDPPSDAPFSIAAHSEQVGRTQPQHNRSVVKLVVLRYGHCCWLNEMAP